MVHWMLHLIWTAIGAQSSEPSLESSAAGTSCAILSQRILASGIPNVKLSFTPSCKPSRTFLLQARPVSSGAGQLAFTFQPLTESLKQSGLALQ